MRKLENKELKKIESNLNYYFNLATENDIKNGLNWYKDSYLICSDISKKYHCTNFVAASVIAALSPRNKWQSNINDTYKVFEALKQGKNASDIKCSTFNKNKFKAFAIAKNEIVINKDSLKTFSFCENIGNLNSNFVTVDIWHLRACFKENINIKSANIGKIAYLQIEKITQKLAKKIGIKGFEYQAIIWLSIKNNYNY